MFNIQSINPYTGKILFSAEFQTEYSVNQSLSLGWEAFEKQSEGSLQDRIKLVNRLKTLLHEDKENISLLMSQEMGKPIGEALAEVEKCILLCEHYAQHAETYLAPRIVSEGSSSSRVEYHPLGIVLGIMPWNFPFWQVFRLAIPSFLAGNVVLLKHAPNVPLSALKIEELFLKAGTLPGVYQNLFVSNEQVEYILSDSRVRGVSLTGSERAGSAVASLAGKYLKKQVLELGGSDPFIVMPSADVKEASRWAMKSRLINNGQSCIAAKRFIVHESVYHVFLDNLKLELQALKLGDPTDRSVHVGPLARLDLVTQLKRQVNESVQQGALVEAEYGIAKEHDMFAPITILSGIKKGMPAYQEELFGPVFSLFKVSSIEEAIELANDSAYGLGASVWTQDEEEQRLVERKIQSGSVFVNAMVRSDTSLPFGGIKNSGYGRELSEEGLREFCNVKTIVHNRSI